MAKRSRSRGLHAELDRGWDHLEGGAAGRAADAARRALALDRRNAEALTLLGAAQLALGEPEDAERSFRRALALEPESVDVLLYLAETLLCSLDEPEEALALGQRAVAAASQDADRVDARLLCAEALHALEEVERARQALAELPPPPYPDPVFALRAGTLWLDLDDLERAEPLLREAVRAEPDLADAHHALALVKERREDYPGMVRSFLRVRELDLAEPAPAWGLTRAAFEKVAEQTLAELPERVRALLANVPIIAEDYPAKELVVEGSDPRMMGFFSGVPYPDKPFGQSPHLDCIFLYQRNVERYARTRAETIAEVRRTLLHESGHFFGLSEEELDELGLG